MAPAAEPAYRRGGVYVVIGGAGGIGEALSEYLIANYQAQLVWIGRRECDAAIGQKLERLSRLGPKPLYVRADAADRADLQRAYELIRRHHPAIHGVVHSALELLDKSLANMDEERFAAGLRAKVDVCVRLAQVFANEPLECLLLFSALQSFVRAAGQSNYAAGCLFKDAFGQRMATDWPCRVRIVNWGYWGSVGIVASPQQRARMARLGIGSIEPDEAMPVLETVMDGPYRQAAYIKTTDLSAVPGLNASATVLRSVLRTSSVMQAMQLLQAPPETESLSEIAE
jgi:polyketide synthase PksN